MPGPTGSGYIVVKKIHGRPYRYRQWSWREPGYRNPRTKSQCLGRATTDARRGDSVRATHKHTGQIVQHVVVSIKPDALALVEPISGIPFAFPYDKWSFEVIAKASPPQPLRFKVGDQFIDKHDGEIMTVTKVLARKRLYILQGATGSDATVTEARLLDFATAVTKHIAPAPGLPGR